MSPAEVVINVERVMLSKSRQLVLLEVAHETAHSRRDRNYQIVDISRISEEDKLMATLLPQILVQEIALPIGFAAGTPSSLVSQGRQVSLPKSHLPTTPRKVSRSSSPAYRDNSSDSKEDTLIFLSKEHWICTYDFQTLPSQYHGAAPKQISVTKYFFLPRDWVNMDLLKLSAVTIDAQIMCSRNGEVAVISNGLKEPWID
jgi:hypothetical protein